MRQMLTLTEADQKAAFELRGLREQAGVTLETFADVLGEKKAVAHKRENAINRVGLWKYLAIVRSFRDFAPQHPALGLIEVLGHRRLHMLGLRDARSTMRLTDYLEAVAFTRAQTPDHPALPLVDHLLYQ